jgi:gentisate 1,2-dioxygenase
MKRYIMIGTGLFIAEALIVLVSLGQHPSPSPTATPAEPGKPTDSSKFDELMPLQPIDRFNGRATVRNARLLAAGQAEIQMTLRNWTISNRQRIERFPETGFLIVQVRSGEDMFTVIDGQRQKRAVEEFFTVPSGSTLSIETGNDSVVLQTLAIKPANK